MIFPSAPHKFPSHLPHVPPVALLSLPFLMLSSFLGCILPYGYFDLFWLHLWTSTCRTFRIGPRKRYSLFAEGSLQQPRHSQLRLRKVDEDPWPDRSSSETLQSADRRISRETEAKEKQSLGVSRKQNAEMVESFLHSKWAGLLQTVR